MSFVIPEQGHIVNILPPADINGGAVTGDVFSLANYAHADIILTLGVTGAASTVLLKECTSAAAAGATAIGFSYYAETTDAGDTLGARTTVANTGFATSTNDNITYCISVDADELSDGSPWLELHLSDPTVATVVSAVAVLSGTRYQSDGNVSAIV